MAGELRAMSGCRHPAVTGADLDPRAIECQ
jgi:hypothetical protein